MPVLEYEDDDRLKNAISLLLESGAGIEARRENRLIVTLSQFEALKNAGLVKPSEHKHGSRRGKKTSA